MPDKNRNMLKYSNNRQKTSKYTKTCKIRLHIFNHGTLKWISMSSSIKYNIARFEQEMHELASPGYKQ